MSELVEQLLAQTPQVRDPQRQQALTDRFLTPALPALEALLLQLRAELDPVLQQTLPAKASKAYPLGQCHGITVAVQRRLASLDPAELQGLAAEGYAALHAFILAGGEMRRAWGDLRGEYFQNALVVGALYVDVSNDTVVVTKPKVEIAPFARSGFKPIADFGHYARIAARYWDLQILPNHLFPELAPYLPLIQISPTGHVSLGSSTRYMLGLTLANGFEPSEVALAAPALPTATFASLAAAVRGGSTARPENGHEGREAALACCRAYRSEGRAACAASFVRAMAAANDANQQLARLTLVAQPA